MKKTCTTSGALLLLSLSSSLSAAVVGVDFYHLVNAGWEYHGNVTNQAGSLNLNQVGTGVVPIAGEKWNAFLADSGTTTGANLLDDSGVGTGINFSVTSAYQFFSTSTYNQIDKGVFDGSGPLIGDALRLAQANLRILNMQLGASNGSPLTLNLSNISYETYDIIVYLGGVDSTGRKGLLSIAGGDSFYYTTQSSTDYKNNPLLVQATATTEDDAAMANYVKFSGLSGDTQDITLTSLGNNIGITGFQIVAVPEPSTYAFAGVGAFLVVGAVVTRRRRKG